MGFFVEISGGVLGLFLDFHSHNVIKRSRNGTEGQVFEKK
jgi:hypothetical protein